RAEQEELLEVLAEAPSLRAEYLRDEQLDALLTALGNGEAEDTAFVERFAQRLERWARPPAPATTAIAPAGPADSVSSWPDPFPGATAGEDRPASVLAISRQPPPPRRRRRLAWAAGLAALVLGALFLSYPADRRGRPSEEGPADGRRLDATAR